MVLETCSTFCLNAVGTKFLCTISTHALGGRLWDAPLFVEEQLCGSWEPPISDIEAHDLCKLLKGKMCRNGILVECCHLEIGCLEKPIAHGGLGGTMTGELAPLLLPDLLICYKQQLH